MAKAVAPELVVKLLETQRRWVMDKSRFKIGMFSRQSGKTFAATLEVADSVMESQAKQESSPWVILSRGERQAEEALEGGVARHLEAYGTMMKTLGREVIEFYDEDKIKRRGLQIIFPGKARNYVVAIPANPDTARGYSANMLFDEFAFHKDSRKIWAAAFPIITRGYKARVISTPNGKGNMFYTLATAENKQWQRYQMDIYQAIAEGAPLNAAELREGLMDDDAWHQEYELKWLDEASAWLPYDLIATVENDHAGLPAHYQGGACFVGVDIGLRRDLFVIWVLEQVGDVLWTREIVALKRASFAEQDAALARVFFTYNVMRCCIDQTGMGEKPVEDAKRNHGSMRVEGILFTSNNKLTLATEGKQAFEDRRIRIPEGDQAIRADLHKLKRETTLSGNARFVADSDSEGHADRAWACFLAVHAAGKRMVMPEDYTAPPASLASRYHGSGQSNDFDRDPEDEDTGEIWQLS
jgi:phage FluMu gp28-like protein